MALDDIMREEEAASRGQVDLKKKKICSLFSLLHTRTIVLTLEKLKWTHRMQPRRMFGRCSVYYVQKLWIKSISMSCNLLHTTSIENIYRAQERRQEGRKVRKRGGKKERKKEREEERKRGRKKERKKEREDERKRGWKKADFWSHRRTEAAPHAAATHISHFTHVPYLNLLHAILLSNLLHTLPVDSIE